MICALVVMDLVVPSLSLMKYVFQHTWVVLIMVSPCAVCISTTFSLQSVQVSKDDVSGDIAPLSTISASCSVVLDSLPANAHSLPSIRALAASSDTLIISAPSCPLAYQNLFSLSPLGSVGGKDSFLLSSR